MSVPFDHCFKIFLMWRQNRFSVFTFLIFFIHLLQPATSSLYTEGLHKQCRVLYANSPNQKQHNITKIPVDHDCRQFAYCLGPKAELATCPIGFHFNVQKQDCDTVARAQCVPKFTPSVDHECPPMRCAVYPSKFDCQTYTLCMNGFGDNRRCNDTSVFDKRRGMCVQPVEGACLDESEEPVKYGIVLPPQTEAFWREKSQPYDSLCGHFWKSAVNKAPHPKECSKFFYCYQGRAILSGCPGGLAFNSSTGNCDYPSNVPNCVIDMKDECVSRPCGMYPTLNCSNFVVCNEGRMVERPCASGYVFDSVFQGCASALWSKCHELPDPSKFPFIAPTFGRTLAARTATNTHSLIPRHGKRLELCGLRKRNASAPIETGTFSDILMSPNLTSFGKWTPWKECPPGMYVKGLQNFRRMVATSNLSDHAGITALALMCATPEEAHNETEIISVIAPNMVERPWKKMHFYHCDNHGPVVGFQLNQVGPQGEDDDIGTDLIRLVCACGPPLEKPYQNTEFKEVSGVRGVWTEERNCESRQAICGLQAQVHEWIESVDLKTHDNTGVNTIKMRCCDVPSPLEKLKAQEAKHLVAILDTRNTSEDHYLEFEISIGLTYDHTEKWEKFIQFHESVGYTIFSLKRSVKRMITTNITCLRSPAPCFYNWSSPSLPEMLWSSPRTKVEKIFVPKNSYIDVWQVVAHIGPYYVTTDKYIFKNHDNKRKSVSTHIIPLVALEKETSAEPKEINRLGDLDTSSFPIACPFLEKKVNLSTPLDTSPDGVFLTTELPTSLGTWLPLQHCPLGAYVIGIAGKRHSHVAPKGHGKLASLGFLCRTPGEDGVTMLTFAAPGVKPEPEWSLEGFNQCEEGVAVGFETHVTSKDEHPPPDIGTDSLRLHCSCGPRRGVPFDSTRKVTVSGHYGEWTKDQFCDRKQAICGLQAQMHDLNNNGESPGLNAVRIKCCNVAHPSEKLQFEERKVLVVHLKNVTKPTETNVNLLIGLQTNTSEKADRVANFYESIGYSMEELKDKVGEVALNEGEKCKTCAHKWEFTDSASLESTLSIHQEPVELPVGDEVDVYQIVATVGYFVVRTTSVVIESTGLSPPRHRPPPPPIVVVPLEIPPANPPPGELDSHSEAPKIIPSEEADHHETHTHATESSHGEETHVDHAPGENLEANHTPTEAPHENNAASEAPHVIPSPGEAPANLAPGETPDINNGPSEAPNANVSTGEETTGNTTHGEAVQGNSHPSPGDFSGGEVFLDEPPHYDASLFDEELNKYTPDTPSGEAQNETTSSPDVAHGEINSTTVPPEVAHPPPEVVHNPPEVVTPPSEVVHIPPELVPPPSEVAHHPPEVVTPPPEVVHNPPKVVTSPPEVAHHPPEVVHHPSEAVNHPPEVAAPPPPRGRRVNKQHSTHYILDMDKTKGKCNFHNKPPAKNFETLSDNSIIISTPEESNWGHWLDWKYCSNGTYVRGVTGYREFVERVDDGIDAVGLAAVGFLCQDPSIGLQHLQTLTGLENALLFSSTNDCPKYLWRKWHTCRPGAAVVGIQHNAETTVDDLGDDLATQNVKVLCSCGQDQMKPYDLETYGIYMGHTGHWSLPQVCHKGQAVCGAQVQLDYIDRDTNLTEIDNTGINNIKFKCCNVPSPVGNVMKTHRDLIKTFNYTSEDPAMRQKYSVEMEVGFKMQSVDLDDWYTSVGHDLAENKAVLKEKIINFEIIDPCTQDCDINWDAVPFEIFDTPKLTPVTGTSYGGDVVQIYQVVSTIGHFIVRSHRYFIVTKRPGENGEEPTVRTQVFDLDVAVQTKLSFLMMDILPSRQVSKPPDGNVTKSLKKTKVGIMSSQKVTDWGDWQEWRFCPNNTFITGLQAHRRLFSEDGIDHLGLSSVGFQCSTPGGKVVGHFGFVTKNLEQRDWKNSKYFTCTDGVAIGFQLNVLPDQGPEDDIATDNVRMFCSDGSTILKPFSTPEAKIFAGEGRGEWSSKRMCGLKQSLCGVRVQSMAYAEGALVDLAVYDNTGINNIEMQCCDTPPISELCTPVEQQLIIGSCDSTTSDADGSCEFKSNIGYVLITPKDKSLSFYENLGANLDEEITADSHNIMHCSNCNYTWDSAPPQVWEPVKKITRTFQVAPRGKTDIYQITGECGFVHVRSNRYILETTFKRTNETKHKTWDVVDEALLASGRTLGVEIQKDCPYHGKNSSSYVKTGDEANQKIFVSNSSANYKSLSTCGPGFFIAGFNTENNTFICKMPTTNEIMYLDVDVAMVKSHLDVTCPGRSVAVGFHPVPNKNESLRLTCSNGGPISIMAAVEKGVKAGKEFICEKKAGLCAVAKEDSKLNDTHAWKFKCCHIGNPYTRCTPTEARVKIKTCANDLPKTSRCDISVGIGIQSGVEIESGRRNCFYGSVGHDFENSTEDIQNTIENAYPGPKLDLYSWDNPKSNIWKKSVIGSFNIVMSPNEIADVYQVIAKCGHIDVKTDLLIKIPISQDPSKSSPETMIYIKS